MPKKSDQEDQEPELRNGDNATESEQGERKRVAVTLLIVTVFQLFPTGVKTRVKPVKCVKLMSSEILKSPILK